MKLKALLKETCIQGDVRISIWNEDEEVEVREILGHECLTDSDIRGFQNLNVKYVFASRDGMLHIELEPVRRRGFES